MDRLEAMSVLLSAVESGSLSKAARKLNVPLATVSRKVADLEAHLMASLLIRSAKGLELTPAGRSFVAAAKSILEQVTEAERAAAGEYTEPRGDLIVTAPIMFGRLHVLPVVTQFLAAFPDVSVGLVLTDRIAHFLDDQVDVAVRVGALPDSSLVASRLGAIRRVMCAAPGYLAARGTPRTPDELSGHSVISFENTPTPTTWTFWSNGEEVKAAFRPRLSVNTIDGAIDAALAGAGFVRSMSYQVARHVQDGALQVVLEAFEPPPPPWPSCL
jgi:DNA-binding transcriptional LysR family regulator